LLNKEVIITMHKTFFFLILSFLFITGTGYSQNLTQTIRGYVFDKESLIPLPGVNLVVRNGSDLKGTITNNEGLFEMTGIPIGRYNLQVSSVGYESVDIPEVLLISGKETVLQIGLKESIIEMDAVTVKPNSRKDGTMNSMAILSGRMFTVEEANRYAGGFDDPGRLATAFPGVGTTSAGSNALIIRGNSPKGVLWLLEGIEIPNPNHFEGTEVVGGGFVSALSSQVLSNSDFYTGAFPAEYGNALSGVFDMRYKTGNNQNREYGFRIDMIGAEVFTEGPFMKNRNASYLVNYRYSTMAIISKMIPDMSVPVYQDLSFKFSFPSKSAGVFNLWGVAMTDEIGTLEPDSTEWKYNDDKVDGTVDMNMGVLGLTHKVILGQNTYVNTTLAATGNSTTMKLKIYGENYNLSDSAIQDFTNKKLTLKSFVNHKFSTRHTNRTGITVNRLSNNLDSKVKSDPSSAELKRFARYNNSSWSLQFFTQSMVNISSRVTLNLGLYSQLLFMNSQPTLEPRAGIKWNFLENNTLSLGYGNHSRLEPLNIYFVEIETPTGITYPNKKLDPTKAHHFGLGYDRKLGDYTRLRIETFYQRLYDVPVIPDSTYSLINFKQEYIFRNTLLNNGEGRNIGIEVTLERFLHKGFYFLLTGTFYDSDFTGDDGNWYNSRYDYGYILNALGGFEFQPLKKNSILGINIKLSAQGGERISPVDKVASDHVKDVVLDESVPYTYRYPGVIFLDMTLSYQINRRKYSTQIGLQWKNVLGEEGEYSYRYNYKTDLVELYSLPVSFPNLFVKFDF